MMKFFLSVCMFLVGCAALSAAPDCCKKNNNIAKILGNMKQATESLQSYSADISYLFSQPLFDSKTLQTGKIYYKKNNDKGLLKIEFNTKQQDDGKTQKQPQIFLFDGIWLHRVDYQTKQAELRQLAEPNKPIGVFDLVKRNFPLVGFSDPDELDENFTISIQKETEKQVMLNLDVKADSIYGEDYKNIKVTIAKQNFLPVKIVAINSEEDMYEIIFANPKVNEPVKADIFDLKIPADFEQNTVTLENGREQNG